MRRALLLAAAPVLLLAGCASTVSLTPAPHATSTGCANLVVRLPSTVGLAERRTTDAQGTGAWGTPAAVTMICGVPDRPQVGADCEAVEGVDWLFENDRVGGEPVRVLTTYGRVPVVRVVVRPAVMTAYVALTALTEPVAESTRGDGRRCTSGPTATPTPTPTPTPRRHR